MAGIDRSIVHGFYFEYVADKQVEFNLADMLWEKITIPEIDFILWREISEQK